MGDEKVISLRIRKESKDILDYLSYITNKSKTSLLDESISLLVQKYKEMGHKIPEQILNISEIKLKELEKISNEIKNDYNIVDKVLTKELEKVLIVCILRGYNFFGNCEEIDYKNIINALLKVDKNETIAQVEKASKIIRKTLKILYKRYDVIRQVIPYIKNRDEEIKSLINLINKNEDIKRLLNALHSGLDVFEKELNELKHIYDRLEKIGEGQSKEDIVVSSKKEITNDDDDYDEFTEIS